MGRYLADGDDSCRGGWFGAVGERALRWAIEHASAGDLIRAVYVWQVYRGALPGVVPLEESELIRPQADHFVREVVDRVVAKFDGPLPGMERVSY